MNSRALIDAMRHCLDEGEFLLTQLDDAAYVRRSPVVMNASIGAHYRHVLDHFRNLLEKDPAGPLDYDRRVRHTPVETDRSSALKETKRLASRLDQLDPIGFEESIEILTRIHHGDTHPGAVRTSTGREAVFCVMHAVHHYALIRVICGLSGHELPSTFGVAPSTVAATKSCLQSAETGR